MASRTAQAAAIVLRVRESPGGARIVTLLTPDVGLIDAFVFGGPKSKLRSLASPYHTGTAWIYHDPVRDFRKLNDFDAERTFSGIREDLGRLWAAGLFAEAIIRTQGAGGEHAQLFTLTVEVLGAIQSADQTKIDYTIIQFVFRLASIMGMAPDMKACSQCNDAFGEGQIVSFLPFDACFRCSNCSGQGSEGSPEHDNSVLLSPGAFRYLTKSLSLPWVELERLSSDDASRRALKAASFALIRCMCESPLSSLARGMTGFFP